MSSPSLASAIPARDNDMARRIAVLERTVAELQAGRSLQAATISRGGITVQGGAITVVDQETGNVVAIIGALPPTLNRSDGSTQPGVLYFREDGSVAALLGDSNPTTPPFKQSWQITDRAGNFVMTDDTNSGHGIGRPYLPGPTLADTNVATWPATTNTTVTTIASAYMDIQHPRLVFSLFLSADPGVTAVFAVTVGGVVVATSPAVTGTIVQWSPPPVDVSASVMTQTVIAVQAQVTAGTGKAAATQLYLAGTQS